MHLVQVDPVRAEPLQAGFDRAANVLGLGATGALLADDRAAELGGYQDVVAALAEGLPEPLLAVTVRVGGVEEVDPCSIAASTRPPARLPRPMPNPKLLVPSPTTVTSSDPIFRVSMVLGLSPAPTTAAGRPWPACDAGPRSLWLWARSAAATKRRRPCSGAGRLIAVRGKALASRSPRICSVVVRVGRRTRRARGVAVRPGLGSTSTRGTREGRTGSPICLEMAEVTPWRATGVVDPPDPGRRPPATSSWLSKGAVQPRPTRSGPVWQPGTGSQVAHSWCTSA